MCIATGVEILVGGGVSWGSPINAEARGSCWVTSPVGVDSISRSLDGAAVVLVKTQNESNGRATGGQKGFLY